MGSAAASEMERQSFISEQSSHRPLPVFFFYVLPILFFENSNCLLFSQKIVKILGGAAVA